MTLSLAGTDYAYGGTIGSTLPDQEKKQRFLAAQSMIAESLAWATTAAAPSPYQVNSAIVLRAPHVIAGTHSAYGATVRSYQARSRSFRLATEVT
eukprot:219686-Rhodomonas_salina.3